MEHTNDMIELVAYHEPDASGFRICGDVLETRNANWALGLAENMLRRWSKVEVRVGNGEYMELQFNTPERCRKPRACVTNLGEITSLKDYINRMTA